MKTLFAYYSFEGNCRALAGHMAEAVGGETAELVPVGDPVPHGTVMKYVVGVPAAMLKKTVALQPLPVDPASFDLVFVGGPVWALHMTPAVRTFLNERDWSGAKLALFAMHRGGAGSVAKAMAELVAARGGRVLGTANFVDLRRGNADKTKEAASSWAAEMIALAGG